MVINYTVEGGDFIIHVPDKEITQGMTEDDIRSLCYEHVHQHFSEHISPDYISVKKFVKAAQQLQQEINKAMETNEQIAQAWEKYEQLTSDMENLTELMMSEDPDGPQAHYPKEFFKLLDALWECRQGQHSRFIQTADKITLLLGAYAEYKAGV